MTHVFGACWRNLGPHYAHVCVWIAADGTETSDYNLGDHTGPHSFSHPTRNAKPYLAELRVMRDEARKEALAKQQYRDARRRDTPIENLRYAFLVTWGRGGSTVHVDEEPDCSSEIQGYGFTEAELAEIDHLGIPFVDSRTIPDHLITKTLSLPMWPDKPGKFDPAPWGGLSFAPIPQLAWLYQQLGATVRNLETIPPTEGELRNLKGWERDALRGWFHSDSVLLANAMLEAREEVRS